MWYAIFVCFEQLTLITHQSIVTNIIPTASHPRKFQQNNRLPVICRQTRWLDMDVEGTSYPPAMVSLSNGFIRERHEISPER